MKLLLNIPTIALAVTCCLFHYGVKGQYKFDNAKYFTKEQGLPDNHVYLIQKGPDGFMWVGTREGLCRFDGQQFKVYRQGSDLRYSLFDNTVNAVLSHGRELWIATNQGISVLNTSNGLFHHYQLGVKGKVDSLTKDLNYAVHVLREDADGNIWVGTRHNGVYKYLSDKDNFQPYASTQNSYQTVVPLLGSNSSILSIEPSINNDSILWAGTVGGLQEINRFTGSVKCHVFPQKDKDYQVAVNAFRRMYHHSDGLLYVGGWSAGLHIFDPATGTLQQAPLSKRWGNILKAPIGSIFRKSDHELWITMLDGLVVYDTQLKDITWTKLNNVQENRYYGVSCIDEHQRIWYANINGIQCFDPSMQQFTSYPFEDLYGKDWAFTKYVISDSTGRMLTACPIQANGLYVFDKLNSSWTKLSFNRPANSKKLVVRGFGLLPDGRFIISSDEGLFTYDVRRKLLQAMKPPPSRFNRWHELVVDNRGRIWLAADIDGLICWDYRTGQARNYSHQITPIDANTPIRVVNLFEDSHHNIWFVRFNGIGVYQAAKDSIINFVYSVNKATSFSYVNSFAEDKAGRIWMSTNEGWLGFARLDSLEKGVVSKTFLPNEKIEGRIYTLATDKEGNVWGYTDKLLVRTNASDANISTFNFQYGLKEVDFYNFSFLPSGEVVFGGRTNIVLAHPATFQRNVELPAPYISEIQVMNQPYLMPALFSDTTISLAYNRNFFTIEFSAQAYTLANEVRFRYRLQGFDEWKEVTGRHMVNYTNVPSGEYTFQLQAANNEGIWNPKMLQLAVHIATPWWQTWWFYTLSFVLVAGFIYWLYRFRIRQVRKKEQLKSQYEKKLANVEMSALLAQMNPHFLFNCLNSIDSYIIKNESRKASEYLNSFARLMRLILQNSRSNYISLKDEIETLELYLQMEGLRFRDQFQYEIRIVTQTDTASIVIPPMLIQPYVENAIWHGLMNKHDGTPRKVELLIEERDNNLYCVILDNGIGRTQAQAVRSQKLNGKKRSMGMQITRDRMEIINKLYGVNTCVTITDLVDTTGNVAGTKVELVVPL